MIYGRSSPRVELLILLSPFLRYVPKLFDFLQREAQLKPEEISTKFGTLDPKHVGSMGKTMAG